MPCPCSLPSPRLPATVSPLDRDTTHEKAPQIASTHLGKGGQRRPATGPALRSTPTSARPPTFPGAYQSEEAKRAEAAFLRQRERAFRVSNTVPDPTALLVIDEADRLREAALEQVRDIFDTGGIGVILIGMPGLEKRLARHPQLYSRIGFVHEFRALAESAIRQLLAERWTPHGVRLPPLPMDEDRVAAIIRIHAM